MAWIAGVDGCPGGWIAVYRETTTGRLDCSIEESFAGVTKRHELDVVAVDMPIGLSVEGRRDCDGRARDALRPWRHRSIFPAPAADVLALFPKLTSASFRKMTLPERERAYNHAKRVNLCRTDKALNRQSFNLVPKIAEVRNYLLDRPFSRRDFVHEVHPEVSFAAMNYLEHGGKTPPFSPMRHPKGSMQGLLERRVLLAREFGGTLDALEGRARGCNGDAAPDDFYDAVACLWTAHRIGGGTARALCRLKGICALANCADKDAKGLPMRIVY